MKARIQFSAQALTRTITEPTGVKDLIEELAEQLLMVIWWDEIASEIKLEAIKPPSTDGIPIWNDDYHLLQSTIKENIKDRISRLVIHYGPIKQTEGDKANHFRYMHVNWDAEAESPNKYDEKSIKTIYARWLNGAGPAVQLAGRMLSRFNKNAKILTATLSAKDSDVWTSGLFYVDTNKIQDETGANKQTLFQALKVYEDEPGTTYVYQAQSSSFDGRHVYFARFG